MFNATRKRLFQSDLIDLYLLNYKEACASFVAFFSPLVLLQFVISPFPSFSSRGAAVLLTPMEVPACAIQKLVDDNSWVTQI